MTTPAIANALQTRSATTRLESALLLANVTLPFVAFIRPHSAWWLTVPFVAASTSWLLVRRAPSRAFSAFWLLFLVVQLSGIPWPASFVVPLILAWIAARVWPPAASAMTWLRMGTFDRGVWQLVLPTIVVSSGGLIAWFGLWQPDVSDIVTAIPTGTSWLAFASFALVFSVLNALWEEFLLKGMMWETLKTILPEGLALNLIQALFFGLIHYHGFPRGITGVAMAAFYGFLLGFIRQRARGMAAVVVSHVFADLTICALLYTAYVSAAH